MSETALASYARERRCIELIDRARTQLGIADRALARPLSLDDAERAAEFALDAIRVLKTVRDTEGNP